MSLYDKAALRCTQNICRAYPAWRQAHMTDDERLDFDEWRALNLAHLDALRAQITQGGTPDIDRGWPVYGDEAEGPVEIIREVEVIREVPVEVDNPRLVQMLEKRGKEVDKLVVELEEARIPKASAVRHFVQSQMRDGDTYEARHAELLKELEVLMNNGRKDPLGPEQERRKQQLTSGLGGG